MKGDYMILPYIDMTATGQNINEIRKASGLSVKDIQEAFGFSTPNAVYKWIHGCSLPTVDNLVVLSRMLNVSMNDIIVVNE